MRRSRRRAPHIAVLAVVLSLGATTCGSHHAARLDRATGAPATTAGGVVTPADNSAATSAVPADLGGTAKSRSATSTPSRAGAPRADAPTHPGPVTLHVFDASGNRVDWGAFRRVESNGKGSDGISDMLLDPQTLTVVQPHPLHATASGDPGFDLPARAVTLSLAWPTSSGYSNLLVDFGAPGVYNFNLLTAEQAVAALDDAVRSRPAYRRSGAFNDAAGQAHARLAAAHSASTDAAKGAAAAVALDDAVRATVALLSEYGPQFAAANRASSRPEWGVTFDNIDGSAGALSTVRDLVGGDPRDGWVRIVFDRGEPAASYTDEVNTAHGLGLHVLGLILDSSDMEKVEISQWQARVASYVSTLPSVDEWEIGNEVNGNWLGPDVPAKVAFAAQYVKAHTQARTLLTLYWQLGEDDADHSMFTWLRANVPPAVMGQIDDVGMSLYPEDHPMGAAFDRVMATLHAAAPAQRILVTELGYWSADLGHVWWWGSMSDPQGDARRQVAALYQSAVMGYPYSGGGAYWWYYLEEALPENALWSTLRSTYVASGGH